MTRRKRLLFLTYYFPPDLSAGSFRAAALTKSLLNITDPHIDIEVLTTKPHRYASYSNQKLNADALTSPHLSIQRFSLPAHKGGFWGQSRSFASYFLKTLHHAQSRRYDAVFATSSRLMTAFLGAHISKSQKIPLYLDIRDIFADGIGHVVPSPLSRLATNTASSLEKRTVANAATVNLVSPGFSDYFESRYPNLRYTFFTNGIDESFQQQAPPPSPGYEPTPSNRLERLVNVVYAGNIGDGQGLHTILPPLASAMKNIATFTVIGDGGRKTHLDAAIKSMQSTNITIKPPVPRTELLSHYGQSDVLFLHLNNHRAFERVLPSKLFEYGATGKPIWAGVGGYAAEFVKTELENAAVFLPCDLPAALAAFRKLTIGHTDRSKFVIKHRREKISNEMAIDIAMTLFN